ncbi:MAG TPA: hypothetical protein VMT85_12785 [Thermoanaerobaculia bacterium]|nr:hypothetical protein [Thermoanaerobaculia bacterium]
MSLQERLARLRGALSPQPWTWCWAVAVTLHAVRSRALRLFDAVQPLDSFRDRAIGATTMQGVDASGYAKGYMELVVLTGAAFVAAAALAALIHRQLEVKGWHSRLPGEIRFVELSSLFVALALSLSFLGRWQALATVAWVLTGFQLLAALLGAARIALLRSGERDRGRARDAVQRRAIARQLGRPALLVHALALATSVGLPLWAILAHHTPLESLSGVPAFVLFSLVSGALAWRTARSLAARAPARRALRLRMVRDLPLLLLPGALVAANELQYRLSQLPVTLLGVAALIVVAALVPLAGTLADRLLPKAGRSSPTAGRLATAVYLPAVLASLALLAAYRHGYASTELDTFHKGEQLLPAHQLFRFGVIPLVDLRLTHTLSDLVYPGLYTLFHGFRGGEHALAMLTWMKWMPLVVAIPLLYFLLASVTTPLFAVLACTTTPVLALMNPYYSMPLLLALLLGHYARRPTVARLAGVWLGLLWVLAWRIDFGLAGGLATLLVLAARSLSGPRLDRRSLARSLVPAAAVAALSLATLALLSAQPLIPALADLLHSYTYRLTTRVRAQIIPSYGILAALQYYLLPATGIAVVLLFVGRRLLGGGRVHSSRYPLLFLALFSLAISVRSLARHSLIEGFNGYFFFLLLVLLPAFVTAESGLARRRRALSFVLALFFLRLLLMLPPAGEVTGAAELSHLLPESRGVELRDWRGDEVRYRFDASPFEDVLAFLERHLEEGETFYDFTNSPALYAIADRRFPTWVISTLAQTSESVQADSIRELDAWYESGRLPFVLFKQGTFWDTLDGVPSEVGSYRIAEWIYRHYRPLARFRGFEVWQDLRDDPLPIDWKTEIVFPIKERITGPSIEVDRLSRRGGVAVRTGEDDPHLYGFLRMRSSPELASRDRWTLEIEGRSSVAERFQVFYRLEGGDFSDQRSFTVSASELEAGETEVWEMRLDETSGVIVDLRIDPPEGAEFEIERVALTGTTIGLEGLAESGVSQSFDLKLLPRVWAELDPFHALEEAPDLATLLDAPALVRPGHSISLPLDPELDRGAVGYAMVRLRSARHLLEPGARSVQLYLRYDRDNCCGFVFDLGDHDDGSVEYLVRLSTQWRWSHGEVSSLRLWTTHPTVVERVELRARD